SQRGPRHLAFSLHSQDELGIDHQRAACESFPSLYGEPRRGSLRAWPSALLICRQLVCPFWCHGATRHCQWIGTRAELVYQATTNTERKRERSGLKNPEARSGRPTSWRQSVFLSGNGESSAPFVDVPSRCCEVTCIPNSLLTALVLYSRHLKHDTQLACSEATLGCPSAT